jgi:hypothetical protein
MSLAPIALFVYNRTEHLKKTIAALKENELASESDLIIFSDGPKNSSDYDKVNVVRKYSHSITGFKSVKIIEREKNIGLANSIIAGVTEAVNQYGKIIVLEDDLVTSPYFLRYMNDGLDIYEKKEEVISIHGYIYPVKGKLPETFFIKGADCLGWATWKRGWDLFEEDGQKLLDELMQKKMTKEFDFNGTYSYTQMLIDQIAGKNSSWAIRWYASAFLKDKFTLYPGETLVSHIGYDMGTHCNDKIQKPEELYNSKIIIEAIPVEENVISKKGIIKYFKCKKRSSLKKVLRSFFNMSTIKKMLKKIVSPFLLKLLKLE